MSYLNKTLNPFKIGLITSTIFFLSACYNDGRTLGRKIDDTTILLKVEKALHDNNNLHSSAVSVNNHGNIIQLSGFVDNHWQKEEAERTAHRVSGVEGVINDVIVKDSASQRISKTWSDAKSHVKGYK